MDPILERYQALENKIKTYNPALDAQRLYNAFTFADNAHSGQPRSRHICIPHAPDSQRLANISKIKKSLSN